MKAWSALAALLIALLTGFNLGHAVRRVPPPPVATGETGVDAVMRAERRFAALRHALLARGVSGTIGYVTELAPDDMARDGPAMDAYFRCQFALVPCVLDARSRSHRWIVVNRRDPAAAAAPDLPGFRQAEDFGAGLALWEKSAP